MLLEVLISLVLLSLALLGLDVMEVYTLHKNLNTYYAAMAGEQLHNLEQRLSMLGGKEGLQEQIARWNTENQEVLPQGKGRVEGSYPAYTISLFWGETKSLSCEQRMWDRAGCITENFMA